MAVRKYWLLKTEAGDYSIDDLERDGRTFWSGIRNYQARNFIRGDMAVEKKHSKFIESPGRRI